MIVVGSCYFLLTLLIPYDPNIDFVFPLNIRRTAGEKCRLAIMSCYHSDIFIWLQNNAGMFMYSHVELGYYIRTVIVVNYVHPHRVEIDSHIASYK